MAGVGGGTPTDSEEMSQGACRRRRKPASAPRHRPPQKGSPARALGGALPRLSRQPAARRSRRRRSRSGPPREGARRRGPRRVGPVLAPPCRRPLDGYPARRTQRRPLLPASPPARAGHGAPPLREASRGAPQRRRCSFVPRCAHNDGRRGCRFGAASADLRSPLPLGSRRLHIRTPPLPTSAGLRWGGREDLVGAGRTSSEQGATAPEQGADGAEMPVREGDLPPTPAPSPVAWWGRSGGDEEAGRDCGRRSRGDRGGWGRERWVPLLMKERYGGIWMREK
jgi:hypothetical protein